MSQNTYNRYMGIAVPGLIADAEFTNKDGLQATEAIGLGLGVVQRIGYPNQGRLPKANKSTIVFAGDLVTSNVVNLKVNGLAMSPVTFSSTHAATMALIVTAIKAIAGVANAVLDTSDTASRTILVYSTDGLACLVTDIAVTAGSTQTTGAATASTTDTLYGVSIFSQAIQQPYPALNQQILYNSGAPVGCLLRGRIWTIAETVVTNGDAVYCRFSGDHSVITGVSTTGTGAGIGAYPHSYASIAALATALGITTGAVFNSLDGKDTLDGALATAKGSGLVVGDSFVLASSSTATFLPAGYAAGFYKDAGNFRNDSDSGKAILVDGMQWRTVTTAVGQLALVDINMPQ